MGNLKSTQALILLLLYLGTLLISPAYPNCPYPTLHSKSPNLPTKYPPKVKPQVAKPPPTVPKPPAHMPKPPTGKPPHISKLAPYFSWGHHYAYPHEPPVSRPPRHSFLHLPPIKPELPIFVTFPITPKSPIVYPPIIPTPPITPSSPVITPPPPHVPKPPLDVPKPPTGHPLMHPKPPIFYPPITPKPLIVHRPIIPTLPVTYVVPQPRPETLSLPPPPHETPPTPLAETCPILKLDECVNELGGLVPIGIGSKTKDTCCPVLAGLLDLDATLCLCTTIKAKLLNINIVIPFALQVLVDCGKTPPFGFQCVT